MKIGDKVRFLNDVGGGTIAGFQDKSTVLVCDEDGFEIPTLIKDVVVIDTDEYNLAKVRKLTPKPKKETTDKPEPTSLRQALVADDEEDEEETDPADLEMTYKPLAQERRGAEELNLFLAFVPTNPRQAIEGAFDAYLVNDCNYYIHYAVLVCDDELCHLRHEGELAPNTKYLLDEVSRDDLAAWERTIIQLMAYKREKTFVPKPVMAVALRIEGPKFYKQNAFQPSNFFRVPALLFDVVRNDKPVRSLSIDAAELTAAMQTPDREVQIPARLRAKAAAEKANDGRREPIEVDLHAHELLDTMVGLEPKDILEYQLKVFRDTMDQHLKERGCRIVFIHGKGNGVLRKAILKDLRTRYANCSYQDASFREYGYGATMVTI